MESCRKLSPLRIIISSEWDVSLCVDRKMIFCLLGAAEKDVSLSEASPASLKLKEIQALDKEREEQLG